MRPTNRIPTHPGEILLQDFMIPMNISQKALSKHLGIPAKRVHEIVHGRRSITAGMAWQLAQAFGNTPEFWMNLQVTYDLARSRPKKQKIVPLVAEASQ